MSAQRPSNIKQRTNTDQSIRNTPKLQEEEKERHKKGSEPPDFAHDSMSDQDASQAEPGAHNRALQLNYLESENTNLVLENEDLNTTLKINKDIIRSLLEGNQKFDAQVEYTLAQMQQENELWESRVHNLKQERDSLQANFLIWKDEIEDLKEGLERKEYLLQIAEQRVGAYEKLLLNLGERDAEVQRKLQEQNIVLKDRKITNVVIENSNLKEQNANLLDQNNQLREQLEQVLAKLQEGQGADPAFVEEISVFQNKMASNYPSKVLDQVRNKVNQTNDETSGLSPGGTMMQSSQSVVQGSAEGSAALWNIGPGGPTISSTLESGPYDQKDYTKKLEQSVSWLEEKLKKAQKEHKVLKKENANMKASNENHIFINEKLNKALKKSEQRIEGLVKRVKQLTDESIVLPKKQLAEEAALAEKEKEVDEPFAGDVSSIMIRPDQIADYNIGRD